MFSTDKNNVDIEVKVLARHTQIGGQEEQQSNTVGRDYMRVATRMNRPIHCCFTV